MRTRRLSGIISNPGGALCLWIFEVVCRGFIRHAVCDLEGLHGRFRREEEGPDEDDDERVERRRRTMVAVIGTGRMAKALAKVGIKFHDKFLMPSVHFV